MLLVSKGCGSSKVNRDPGADCVCGVLVCAMCAPLEDTRLDVYHYLLDVPVHS